MVRPRLRIPRVSLPRRPTLSQRSLHTVPDLKQFTPEEGVPGLLRPRGFDIAWTQYMNFTVEKLNVLIVGTDFEHQDTLAILKATAREPLYAAVFNYASMAHNNALFFDSLVNLRALGENKDKAKTEPEDEEDRIPPRLKQELVKNFSSIETLRREILLTAIGMFGPGFVWLVKNAKTTEMRILTTYLAGTPYTTGHWRRQGVDMNTQGMGSPETVRGFLERGQVGAGADTGTKFMSQNQAGPGGVDVIPLLCLNTWEHVWLPDYGVGTIDTGGKRLYVERWWHCIDWDKVEGRANLQRKSFET
ncbi:manganese and iron superoxide dismutase [Xylariaceae sp. FL0662B]|nr:manganese and iron superoxide dismutase [Xylariaceae sp. FL0662B]